MQRSRNWCYTLNNYNDEQLERLLGLPEFLDYLCFGKEVGGTEGTPHLQGFARTKNRMSCAAFREAFGIPETHIEPSKGTAAQGIVYCEKEGSFFEVGKRPVGQGKRTELTRVCERICDGDSVLEACDDDPTVFVKYHRGLQAYQQAKITPRSSPVQVIWCYGATGTGKTRWCYAQAPLAYWKEPGNKWWCGYGNQESVIIDDWRPSKELPLNYMLRLFDR